MSYGQHYLVFLKHAIVPIVIICSSIYVLMKLLADANINYKNQIRGNASRLILDIVLLLMFVLAWLSDPSIKELFLKRINTIIMPEQSQVIFDEVLFIVLLTIITVFLINILFKAVLLFWWNIVAIYRKKTKKPCEITLYACSGSLLNNSNQPDVGVKVKVIAESGNEVANLVSDSWGKFYFNLPKGKYKLEFEASESGIDRPDETIYAGRGIRKLLDSSKETMQIIIHKLKNKK